MVCFSQKTERMIPMTVTRQRIDTVFFAMGTVCRIAVFEDGHEDAVQRAKDRVTELHNKLNAYDPKSEISAINNNAGRCSVTVSDDTRALIERAVAFSKLTDGIFDITTTPLSQLWKTAIKIHFLPLFYEVEKAKELVSYRDILINGNKIMLRREQQKLDLGATAKGFAADEVKRILSENGVTDAIINLGGTIFVMGEAQKVGIQNPFEKTGVSFASLELSGKAVVTSGMYEQGFTMDGKTYHHIINPRTGYPSQTELAGVTLVGESAEKLDALSTTAFMFSLPRAVDLIRSADAEAVFVNKTGNVYVTDGLKPHFAFIETEVTI